MEKLLAELSGNISEACFNDILGIIENILFEEENTEKKQEFSETDDDYKNPVKRAAFWNNQYKHYTEGEGRKHEYARQLAMYSKRLAKSYQKDADKLAASQQAQV